MEPLPKVEDLAPKLRDHGIDGSLEYWRKAHWAFFSRECRRIGRQPSDDMLVVCCSFEVLHAVPPQSCMTDEYPE